MRKNILLILCAVLFAFGAMLLVGGAAGAQEVDDGLPNPGITPDSPFYFLDIWTENIRTFVTFGDGARGRRFLTLANERLAEARAMAEKNNSTALQSVVRRYEQALENADKHIQKRLSDKDLTERIAEVTGKHQAVLERVLETAPENAREGLQNALEKSSINHRADMRRLAELDEDRSGDLGARLLEVRLQHLRELLQEEGLSEEEINDLLTRHDEYRAFLQELKENRDDLRAAYAERLADVFDEVYDIEDGDFANLSPEAQARIKERVRGILEEHRDDLNELRESRLERAAKAYARALERISERLRHKDRIADSLLDDLDDLEEVGDDISDDANKPDHEAQRARVLQIVGDATQKHIDVLMRVRDEAGGNARSTLDRVIEQAERNRDQLLERKRVQVRTDDNERESPIIDDSDDHVDDTAIDEDDSVSNDSDNNEAHDTPQTRSFTIAADDNGYTASERLLAHAGDTVQLTFNVSETDVYFGGLQFTSSAFDTGSVAPGGSATVEFVIRESITFTAFWPASSVKKWDAEIRVE